MAKIHEREENEKAGMDKAPAIAQSTGLDPKVIEVYTR
jgi:hypothetical protein